MFGDFVKRGKRIVERERDAGPVITKDTLSVIISEIGAKCASIRQRVETLGAWLAFL